MEYNTVQFSTSIIRALSIFQIEIKKSSYIKKLKSKGYERLLFDENTLNIFKDQYYSEFKDFIFDNTNENVQVYRKYFNLPITFTHKNQQVNLNYCDIYLFPNDLHFFSLDYSQENLAVNELSQITYCIQQLKRNISVEIDSKQENDWLDWIENSCLLGIKIRSKKGEKVLLDNYSGSKFKLFTILESKEEINHKDRLNLLYDIGTVSKIGTSNGTDYFSPNETYLKSVLDNTISVFKNYDALPLFDSFTVIGKNVINDEAKLNTWNTTFFRIILYNFFIKYNLFKFNNEVKDDSLETRDQFEKFVNHYTFYHVSFNFLPNLILKKHRLALDIDDELALFQKRITQINHSIQEKQQSRLNSLITLVTLFSSISSIYPIYNFLDQFRLRHHWSFTFFVVLLSLVLTSVFLIVIRFIFPEQSKKVIKKWRTKPI